MKGEIKIKLSDGRLEFSCGESDPAELSMGLNIILDSMRNVAFKQMDTENILTWMIMSALTLKYGLSEAMARFEKFDKGEVDEELRKVLKWLND